MYNVKVNDQFNFEIDAEESSFIVNGEPIVLDRIQVDSKSSHIIYQNKSYSIEVLGFDRAEKTAAVKVNGTVYKVEVADQFDQLLKQLGMDNLSISKVQQIKAPMPGLVLSVLVAVGDEIKKGDSLLVLEAMKMENMIKSPTDGVIKNITINKGDKVEKNQVLINFNL